MEFWIRSQDKKRLVKVEDVYMVEDKDNFTSYIGNTNVGHLGEYKKVGRALEVLDEIQKKINLINIGHDFGSPMIDLKNPTYIYEMPKE